MGSAEIIENARKERERIVGVLQAIKDVRTAKAQAQDDTLSEAGEYLALRARLRVYTDMVGAAA